MLCSNNAQQIESHKSLRSILGVASSSDWRSRPRLALVPDWPWHPKLLLANPDWLWHPGLILASRIRSGTLEWHWYPSLARAPRICPSTTDWHGDPKLASPHFPHFSSNYYANLYIDILILAPSP